MKSDSAALAIADRLFAWAALLVLAFVSHRVLSSVQSAKQSTPKSGTTDQSSTTDQKGSGVITGTVARCVSPARYTPKHRRRSDVWQSLSLAKWRSPPPRSGGENLTPS